MKLCLGSVTETCCGIDCLGFYTYRNSSLSLAHHLSIANTLSKTLYLACLQHNYALRSSVCNSFDPDVLEVLCSYKLF
jgi:hypothetical protein